MPDRGDEVHLRWLKWIVFTELQAKAEFDTSVRRVRGPSNGTYPLKDGVAFWKSGYAATASLHHLLQFALKPLELSCSTSAIGSGFRCIRCHRHILTVVSLFYLR